MYIVFVSCLAIVVRSYVGICVGGTYRVREWEYIIDEVGVIYSSAAVDTSRLDACWLDMERGDE